MDNSTNSRTNTATHACKVVSPGVSCLLLVHDEFEREGLRGLLANRGMNSVQSISSFKSATQTVSRLRPDVVIAVVGNPPDCPLDLLAPIRMIAPESGVIVLCDPVLVRTYLPVIMSIGDIGGAGVKLLVRATLENGDRMITAVAQVLDGHQSFEGEVIDLLVRTGAGRSESLVNVLTKKEFQVLELVGSGAANSNIARRLGMGPASVGNILTRIFAKLGFPVDPDLNRRALVCREFFLEYGPGGAERPTAKSSGKFNNKVAWSAGAAPSFSFKRSDVNLGGRHSG